MLCCVLGGEFFWVGMVVMLIDIVMVWVFKKKICFGSCCVFVYGC